MANLGDEKFYRIEDELKNLHVVPGPTAELGRVYGLVEAQTYDQKMWRRTSGWYCIMNKDAAIDGAYGSVATYVGQNTARRHMRGSRGGPNC